MGKNSRPYPSGYFRLYKTNRSRPGQTLAVQMEYNVNSVAVRRSTGYFVKEADWNRNENGGRGGVRSGYGPDYRTVNNRLLKKVSELDILHRDGWCSCQNKNRINIILQDYLDTACFSRR